MHLLSNESDLPEYLPHQIDIYFLGISDVSTDNTAPSE